MTRAIGWPLIWTLVGMLIVLLEGIALGQPKPGATLSEVIRNHVRFDPIGRAVFVPLWFWLTWHWVIRSEPLPMESWRDLVALGVGLVFVIVEWKFFPRGL